MKTCGRKRTSKKTMITLNNVSVDLVKLAKVITQIENLYRDDAGKMIASREVIYGSLYAFAHAISQANASFGTLPAINRVVSYRRAA